MRLSTLKAIPPLLLLALLGGTAHAGSATVVADNAATATPAPAGG